MKKSKTKETRKCVRTTQEIGLIRVSWAFIGRKRYIFWHGGGRAFYGRASHMQALKAARIAAEAIVDEPKNAVLPKLG